MGRGLFRGFLEAVNDLPEVVLETWMAIGCFFWIACAVTIYRGGGRWGGNLIASVIVGLLGGVAMAVALPFILVIALFFAGMVTSIG